MHDASDGDLSHWTTDLLSDQCVRKRLPEVLRDQQWYLGPGANLARGGRSYLWHPPAWLLVPVVRRTTTVTDVGCRVEVPTRAQRALDGQFQSSRVRFKPGFVSHQAETSFTKGSGTPGLNLALEDWSCPPLGQHNTNHSCSCRVPRVADQSPARVLLLESDSD